MEAIYKEYLNNYRSVIFDTWKEAEAFTAYLQSINHKIEYKLKTTLIKSMGKDCVHVVEPLCTHKGK